ncbi:MAG TPA: thiamine phosphate synthase [Gaiellaceae bacterium]|nr:thiamine phosphate synthase [Gaiellaceae bacterium]
MDGGLERRAKLARSRLYLVLEARPHGDDPSRLLDAALGGGVDVVQLRDKELRDDELVRAAEPFRRACAAHGALFVLNDRPDLVERAGADGVHVGQEDTPLADTRRLVGAERIVGLSATTEAELAGDPDYFGVGAIYGTPTKPDADAGGLGLVRAARDRLRVPWFAIGGIDHGTVEEVVAHGAPGAAVVRAVRDADDPARAARELRAALPPSDAVLTAGAPVLLPQIDFLYGTRSAEQQPVPPHVHEHHTDHFFLLDGSLEFRLGDGTARLPEGSCAVAPPLLVHGFRNPGGAEARFLNLHAPGIWARGRTYRLPREQHDQFGPERRSGRQRPIVTGPGDGDRLQKPHRLALVKAETEHAAILEYAVDDGYDGASPHLHLRHADCFHVLEGELELVAEAATLRAAPGETVVVPPGVAHSFTTRGRARFLNVHAPSCGFVEYLRRTDAGEQFDPSSYDVYQLT